MRTPVCSLVLTPDNLTLARQWAGGLGALLGMRPLPQARWLTAVSGVARQAVEAGGGTLTLCVDSDSADCAGPCLAAEIQQVRGSGALPAAPESAAMARARLLVDHVGLLPGPGDGLLLTLETGLSADPPAPENPGFRAQVEALLQTSAATALEALAQHETQLFEALLAVEAAQAELAATRAAHGEALALLAHDLRSPLLTLNLSLEMLRVKPHSPAELEERREVMKRQADQLKALAAGLLATGGPQGATSHDPHAAPR